MAITNPPPPTQIGFSVFITAAVNIDTVQNVPLPANLNYRRYAVYLFANPLRRQDNTVNIFIFQ